MSRRILRALGRGRRGVSRVLERRPWTRWIKKILVFPIGERFAVISLGAALTTPRATFIVVLAWGLVATLYAVAIRTVRSLQ